MEILIKILREFEKTGQTLLLMTSGRIKVLKRNTKQ